MTSRTTIQQPFWALLHIIQLFNFFFSQPIHLNLLSYWLFSCNLYIYQPFSHCLLIIPDGMARDVVWDLGLGTGGKGYKIWVCAYIHQLYGHPLLIIPGGIAGDVVQDPGLETGGEVDGIWALTGGGLAEVTGQLCAVWDHISGFTFILSTSSCWTHFDHKTENTADEHRHKTPPSYLPNITILSTWISEVHFFFGFSVWSALFGVFFFFFGGGTQVWGPHFVEGGTWTSKAGHRSDLRSSVCSCVL